jgi:hypothetical protein
MRVIFAALLFATFGSLIGPARADFRWCAISNEGTINCWFSSMDQCRATVSGVGGFCMPQAPVGHRQPTSSSIEATRNAREGNP